MLVCVYVYLYLLLREDLVCLAQPQYCVFECVCFGRVHVHVKQKESEEVLWDVSVLDQCVVVQP